ncbi:angiopoietin-related protein 6-like [Saccostrea echinata]|uniref:angiopoietin-related protein 6-like n=1 Tax=Saccostrea echinata TaxID=191078 RepID=UPI002A7F6966|nr:angiopoietin-related protein 6-like [Saccostrea echinata]
MTTDEGGWTVIQKREDGDVDFYRTWKDYKHGFGNASKNYWIHVGNDAVRALTRDQNQELRVYLKRYNGEQAYAKYTTFYIGDENNKYTITVSGYSGTASDSLAYHNGMRFSTYDQKNDNAVEGSCAIEYRGGWWYNWCHKSNLNGEYALSPVIGPKYPTWLYWKNTFEALQKTFTLCRSVDWIREEKTCRLNTRFPIKNVSPLMTEDSIIHVDRKNFPQHLVGDCLNYSCTEDAICIRGNCLPVLAEKIYKDCSEILKRNSSRKGQDGIYIIYADTRREVFCDMTTDGGGWTVIQKREDGDVDFFRTWKEYKHGFGNASKNYWIGNDAIHALTRDQNQELRVDLRRFNGEQAYAEYAIFYIGDENDKYYITVSGYSGTASDSLAYHSGMRFSTKDQDNDTSEDDENCAEVYRGAWWYGWCLRSNLNGQYSQSPVHGPQYPVWLYWKNSFEALKKTVMMIRHKN